MAKYETCKTCIHEGEDYRAKGTYCYRCIRDYISGKPLSGYETINTNDSKKSKDYFDAHYNGTVQPIEIMQAHMSQDEFIGFLKGNIIKYVCRMGKKDAAEKETAKIARYAEWLVKASKGETINPRE